MTIIKLSLDKKVLEQLSYYFFKQNTFFYVGKFYSSKKKASGMGPGKSSLTISNQRWTKLMVHSPVLCE